MPSIFNLMIKQQLVSPFFHYYSQCMMGYFSGLYRVEGIFQKQLESVDSLQTLNETILCLFCV